VKELQSIDWQTIVLDEAQNVKKSRGEAVPVRAATILISDCTNRDAGREQASRTMVDFRFLNPGYLGPRQFFSAGLRCRLRNMGMQLQTLRSLVQPFILRRLKTDREIIQDLQKSRKWQYFALALNRRNSINAWWRSLWLKIS